MARRDNATPRFKWDNFAIAGVASVTALYVITMWLQAIL